ncbi:MAG: kelch repeat-containing protein [Calditrichia bacterium]
MIDFIRCSVKGKGLGIIMALLGMICNASAQSDNWAVIGTMPTPRAAFSANEINGLIYIVSGDSGGLGGIASVESYDPVSGVWTSLSPIPTARVVFASAVANGKIYIIGGQADIFSTDLSVVEAYDPGTDSWTTAAPMPTARRVFSASTLNGKIYAIGGLSDAEGILDIVEVYDPSTDSWDTTATNMPTARWGLSTVTANGKIYAIGGVPDSLATGVVEAYDPVTNSWTTVGSVSSGKVAFSATELNGKIYAIGGSFDSFPYTMVAATVEEYDPITNVWTPRSSLNVGRYFLSTSAANGKIYAFGGHTADIFSNILAPEVEEYTPPITSIDPHDASDLTTFRLHQNYPNPFNPTTTISYSIPKSGYVKLKIYDMLGKEVKTLVNQFQSMGSYSFSFDAGNLSSGIYIYKLKADDYMATKKMILLR